MGNSFDEGKLRKELKRGAERVTREDLERAVQKSQKIEEKVMSTSILSREWAKVRLLLMLLKDYWEGNYEEIPWSTIAAIVVVKFYILSPIDIVPDFIPVIGYSDDIALMLLVWRLISEDVKKYARWKAERDEEARRLYEEAFGEVYT